MGEAKDRLRLNERLNIKVTARKDGEAKRLNVIKCGGNGLFWEQEFSEDGQFHILKVAQAQELTAVGFPVWV